MIKTLNRIKNILSLILCAVLFFGIFPTTAFAAGESLAFSGAGISNPTLVAVGQKFTLGVACESSTGRVANVPVTITCDTEINATNSQSMGMLPVYFENLAFTTAGNKTITATATINTVPCTRTYNITVQAAKSAAPTASIDYVAEKLTGLTTHATYSFGGTDGTVAGGEYAIPESWMNGASLVIYGIGDGSTTVQSETQTLTIPARPAAPTVSAINATIVGGTGSIDGTATDMEYSTDQTNWTDCAAGSTTNLAQDTYYVRTKAVANTTFASEQTQVDIGAASDKAITSFTLAGAAGTIDEAAETIAVTLPYGTDVTSLTPTVVHTGVSISPDGTAQDFSSPVTYTVTAADSSTKDYVVTVNIAANSAKDITAFSIGNVNGIISGAAITVNMPYGTNKANLTPTITHTGVSVSPDTGVAQDFTNPVTYTVTAADSSTKDYVVTVNVAANNAKDITAFSIGSVNGIISGSAITVTMPYGTNKANLTPTITHTGVSISPASGVAQDFTNPVTYTVTAADGSTKNYTVTVTVSSSGNGGGGGSSSDSGGSSYTPTPTYPVTVTTKPDFPTSAKTTLTTSPDKNAALSYTITKEMVQQALDKAKEEAKNKGRESYGYSLEFAFSTTATIDSLNITFNADALALLESAGIKETAVTTNAFRFSFDLAAIKEINKQRVGNAVTVSASRTDKLSDAAKKLIGSRPVWDVTISYKNGGKTENITNLGKGAITMGMKYAPASTEKTGNLAVVYVPGSGKPQILTNSSYDNGWMIWQRSSLSVYGVGYITPAPAFTDTANHWGSDNINFVASRGLISGTSATAFSPDTAITRADYLMALGKLSGADVSGYTTSSFTDVANTNPAMPFIEWAVKNKIVQGIGNNQFGPDHKITREQMAVMMVNYAKATGYTLPVSRQAVTFADDAKISAYAKDAVKAIQQAGIIVGKTGNLFDPQGSATRAEAATILRRFVELVIDEGTARGWVQNDSGQWQYINTNGKAVTGWLTTTTGSKFWFDDKGIMVAGKWLQIDGKWYYFDTDGKVAVNTTIDGYEVGADGARK